MNNLIKCAKNNKVLNMMSIALNKPKAKLKKFCKYLSVFEKNIHLTPKSIANKINEQKCNLPENIRSTILFIYYFFCVITTIVSIRVVNIQINMLNDMK
jgi:hypothetical protein